MTTRCGEGWATPPTMDSAISPGTNHDLCHQASALPGEQWVLVAGGAYSHHNRAYSRDFSVPYMGRDPVEITGKNRDFALT